MLLRFESFLYPEAYVHEPVNAIDLVILISAPLSSAAVAVHLLLQLARRAAVLFTLH